MTPNDPLQCTFEDARRTHLREGIALSTSAKVAFFEEMVAFAVSFGARNRMAERVGTYASAAGAGSDDTSDEVTAR